MTIYFNVLLENFFFQPYELQLQRGDINNAFITKAVQFVMYLYLVPNTKYGSA